MTVLGDLNGSLETAKNTSKRRPSQKQVPSAAKWLGALGASPFIILAFSGAFLENFLQERIHFALAAYGAVILSFLGGIHWGLAIARADPDQKNGATFARLGVSVIPSLVGWCALLLSAPIALPVMSIAFCGLLLFDWHVSLNMQAPAWYPKLRWPLTVIVVTSLTFATFA